MWEKTVEEMLNGVCDHLLNSKPKMYTGSTNFSLLPGNVLAKIFDLRALDERSPAVLSKQFKHRAETDLIWWSVYQLCEEGSKRFKYLNQELNYIASTTHAKQPLKLLTRGEWSEIGTMGKAANPTPCCEIVLRAIRILLPEETALRPFKLLEALQPKRGTRNPQLTAVVNFNPFHLDELHFLTNDINGSGTPLKLFRWIQEIYKMHVYLLGSSSSFGKLYKERYDIFKDLATQEGILYTIGLPKLKKMKAASLMVTTTVGKLGVEVPRLRLGPKVKAGPADTMGSVSDEMNTFLETYCTEEKSITLTAPQPEETKGFVRRSPIPGHKELIAAQRRHSTSDLLEAACRSRDRSIQARSNTSDLVLGFKKSLNRTASTKSLRDKSNRGSPRNEKNMDLPRRCKSTETTPRAFLRYGLNGHPIRKKKIELQRPIPVFENIKNKEELYKLHEQSPYFGNDDSLDNLCEENSLTTNDTQVSTIPIETPPLSSIESSTPPYKNHFVVTTTTTIEPNLSELLLDKNISKRSIPIPTTTIVEPQWNLSELLLDKNISRRPIPILQKDNNYENEYYNQLSNERETSIPRALSLQSKRSTVTGSTSAASRTVTPLRRGIRDRSHNRSSDESPANRFLSRDLSNPPTSIQKSELKKYGPPPQRTHNQMYDESGEKRNSSRDLSHSRTNSQKTKLKQFAPPPRVLHSPSSKPSSKVRPEASSNETTTLPYSDALTGQTSAEYELDSGIQSAIHSTPVIPSRDESIASSVVINDRNRKKDAHQLSRKLLEPGSFFIKHMLTNDGGESSSSTYAVPCSAESSSSTSGGINHTLEEAAQKLLHTEINRQAHHAHQVQHATPPRPTGATHYARVKSPQQKTKTMSSIPSESKIKPLTSGGGHSAARAALRENMSPTKKSIRKRSPSYKHSPEKNLTRTKSTLQNTERPSSPRRSSPPRHSRQQSIGEKSSMNNRSIISQDLENSEYSVTDPYQKTTQNAPVTAAAGLVSSLINTNAILQAASSSNPELCLPNTTALMAAANAAAAANAVNVGLSTPGLSPSGSSKLQVRYGTSPRIYPAIPPQPSLCTASFPSRQSYGFSDVSTAASTKRNTPQQPISTTPTSINPTVTIRSPGNKDNRAASAQIQRPNSQTSQSISNSTRSSSTQKTRPVTSQNTTTKRLIHQEEQPRLTTVQSASDLSARTRTVTPVKSNVRLQTTPLLRKTIGVTNDAWSQPRTITRPTLPVPVIESGPEVQSLSELWHNRFRQIPPGTINGSERLNNIRQTWGHVGEDRKSNTFTAPGYEIFGGSRVINKSHGQTLGYETFDGCSSSTKTSPGPQRSITPSNITQIQSRIIPQQNIKVVPPQKTITSSSSSQNITPTASLDREAQLLAELTRTVDLFRSEQKHRKDLETKLNLMTNATSKPITPIYQPPVQVWPPLV